MDRKLLQYLVEYLVEEGKAHGCALPPAAADAAQGGLASASAEALWLAFRSLVNVRPPWPAPGEFLAAQDELLQGLIAEAGVATLADTTPSPTDPRLRLWRGDITTLAADAIVNAAKDAGLNMKKLAADVKRKDVRAEVDADITEGQRIGVQGTPYFLINNLVARGALSSDLFKEAINMALQAAPSGQK